MPPVKEEFKRHTDMYGDMRKSSHYVVFGAAGQHNKAVLIGPSKQLSGYECIIVGLKDGEKYKAGDEIEISDIDCIYFTMYFTRLDSLKAFADTINSVIKRWEEKSGQDNRYRL